jgi:AcrR family transcriptional regulator
MASRKTRAYRSSLRDAQAAQTRARILETARELLEREGPEGLSLPRVAAAAGVSAPTVYRYFPTVPDLLAAFLEWLRPRVGMTVERLLGSPEQALRNPEENFPRFEEHGALLRALNDSPAFNRVRHPSIRNRAGRAAALFSPLAPGWRQRDLAAAVGAIYALGTPETWRWLRDTWGLDPEEARRSALWGMSVLGAALRAGPAAFAAATADPRAARPIGFCAPPAWEASASWPP